MADDKSIDKLFVDAIFCDDLLKIYDSIPKFNSNMMKLHNFLNGLNLEEHDRKTFTDISRNLLEIITNISLCTHKMCSMLELQLISSGYEPKNNSNQNNVNNDNNNNQGENNGNKFFH